MEDANRIRAAANAGDNRARQFAFDFEDLRARVLLLPAQFDIVQLANLVRFHCLRSAAVDSR